MSRMNYTTKTPSLQFITLTACLLCSKLIYKRSREALCLYYSSPVCFCQYNNFPSFPESALLCTWPRLTEHYQLARPLCLYWSSSGGCVDWFVLFLPTRSSAHLGLPSHFSWHLLPHLFLWYSFCWEPSAALRYPFQRTSVGIHTYIYIYFFLKSPLMKSPCFLRLWSVIPFICNREK